MKIQLDTENKVIKVEGSVNLGELTETLERLLPDGNKNLVYLILRCS